MGLLWYELHDRSIRLSHLQRMQLHWRANLAMLRSPRAVLNFTALSLLPFGLWFGTIALAGEWFGPSPKGYFPSREYSTLVLISLPVYLFLQHLAFIRAMHCWYIPFARRALGSMGHRVCIGCGQREAPGGVERCPECGHAETEGPQPPRGAASA